MSLFIVNAVVVGSSNLSKNSEADVSFDSFSEFLAMGGHGLYVWLSYAIAIVILVINVVNPVLQKKKVFSELKRRLRREKKA